MKKRLLIVEDNARLLKVIAVYLKKAGFDVMTARDADEALLKLAETIPDLIVSDIMMPGIDGFAFAASIRSNPRTDLIPIVFLTAKDRCEDRIRGFRTGVDAYLVKPFEPEELVAVIENILSRIARTHRRVARMTTPADEQKKSPESADHPAAPAADDDDDDYGGKNPALSERRGKTDSLLTAAEERVARLVAQTLSNKEIAVQLRVSIRTVEMHISRILAKKGFSNRVEIARFIIQRESAE